MPLSLTRREGQAIRLTNKATGEVIRIEQQKTSPHQSRVSVEASQDWLILREELCEEFRHLPEDTKETP